MLRRGVELRRRRLCSSSLETTTSPHTQGRVAVGRIWYACRRLSSLVKGLYSLTGFPIGRLGRITLTYNIK